MNDLGQDDGELLSRFDSDDMQDPMYRDALAATKMRLRRGSDGATSGEEVRKERGPGGSCAELARPRGRGKRDACMTGARG